jgi:hypothetical protein
MQQNGRHERMHLTLKQEATRPAGDLVGMMKQIDLMPSQAQKAA